MPLFVYKPEGADPRRWDFQPGKILNTEAKVIEKMTGMSFGEWQDAMIRGSITAMEAYLFVMLKREHPTLRPAELVFCTEDLDVEFTDEETVAQIAELREKAATEGLSDREAAYLEALEEQAPAVVDAPEEYDAPTLDEPARVDDDPADDAGKAPA